MRVNVAVQERKATCRIIASTESSTHNYVSPIKNWCLPYQDGDVATVASVQMIYQGSCVPCIFAMSNVLYIRDIALMLI